MRKTLIIGHRGAGGEAPENTLAAIERGIAIGVDRIEIDVRQTSDKKVVVVHDSSLRRINGNAKRIKNMTYAELLKVDFGEHFSAEFKGQHLPLLEEVLEKTKGKNTLLIEIKNRREYHRGLERRTWDIVKSYQAENDCIFQSFDDNSLFALRDMKISSPIHKLFATFVPIRPYYAGSNLHYKKFKRYDFVEEVGLKQGYVNRKVIQKIHQMGKKVNVWTVNKPYKMIRLSNAGVDGIITDLPSLAIKTLR